MFRPIRNWLLPEMTRPDSRPARKNGRASTLRNGLPRFEALEGRRMLSVSPVGPEFRINTYTPSDRRTDFESSPTTAMDAEGDFVSSWSSMGQGGWGVYAQAFSAVGVAHGPAFRVNSARTLRRSTMKCLNQLTQLLVLVLCMGGLLAYVLTTDPATADSLAPAAPRDWHIEYRDPNNMCQPTVALALRRQRELGGTPRYTTGAQR
jgi:hypothetical protein